MNSCSSNVIHHPMYGSGHCVRSNGIYNFVYRCANGYIGQRCEFKDLDGSYLRKYYNSFSSYSILEEGSLIYACIGGVHTAIKRRACYNALTVTMWIRNEPPISLSPSPFLLPSNRPFSRNVRALRLAEARRGQERVRARPKKVTTKFFFFSLQPPGNV